jgi:hypothetical protein
MIFPLWGKWPERPMGALFSVFRFPREGGDPDPFSVREGLGYILLFAGNAIERTRDDPLTQPSPPQGGEGFIVLIPLPVGEGWVRALFS